jgi:hypothetical protein
MIYRADLHIHSCLSPCGSLEMAPSAIVERAQAVGLNAIALADHNSVKNGAAFWEHCERAGMKGLVGMEVNTQEEVHALCLFDRLEAAMELDALVYAHLPEIRRDPQHFGDQVYVNADNEIEGVIEKYLISAVDIPLSDMMREVHLLGGLFIPAHVDRESYSIVSQLGFIPDEPFDALEVTRRYDRVADPLNFATRYRLITSSDAHRLEDIGTGFTEFDLPEWSVDALHAACL